jgi:hypothetical protein
MGFAEFSQVIAHRSIRDRESRQSTELGAWRRVAGPTGERVTMPVSLPDSSAPVQEQRTA